MNQAIWFENLNKNMSKILDQNIIEYLGIVNLDEETREKTLLRVGKIIYQAVIMRAVELLDEGAQTKFSELLDEIGSDEKRQDEILEFLQKEIPNLDEIVKEEIIKIKEETVSVMGALK